MSDRGGRGCELAGGASVGTRNVDQWPSFKDVQGIKRVQKKQAHKTR